jgi:hypothetical protein
MLERLMKDVGDLLRAASGDVREQAHAIKARVDVERQCDGCPDDGDIMQVPAQLSVRTPLRLQPTKRPQLITCDLNRRLSFKPVSTRWFGTIRTYPDQPHTISCARFRPLCAQYWEASSVCVRTTNESC